MPRSWYRSKSLRDIYLTNTCDVKREPAISAGGIQDPETEVATDVPCGEVDPIRAEEQGTLELDTPHKIAAVFVEGTTEIRNGDILVIDSTEYPVKAAEPWEMGDRDFWRCLVEVLNR